MARYTKVTVARYTQVIVVARGPHPLGLALDCGAVVSHESARERSATRAASWGEDDRLVLQREGRGTRRISSERAATYTDGALERCAVSVSGWESVGLMLRGLSHRVDDPAPDQQTVPCPGELPQFNSLLGEEQS